MPIAGVVAELPELADPAGGVRIGAGVDAGVGAIEPLSLEGAPGLLIAGVPLPATGSLLILVLLSPVLAGCTATTLTFSEVLVVVAGLVDALAVVLDPVLVAAPEEDNIGTSRRSTTVPISDTGA